MTIDSSCGVGDSDAADTLLLVGRQLAEASHRLGMVAHTAAQLAAATNWQTAAARRFHRAAGEWRDECVVLIARADDVATRVSWAQVRVMLRAGGGC